MQQGMQVQLPQMTKFNAYLIAVSAAIFLLDSILVQAAGVSLSRFLGLSWQGVSSGLIYQFVSYPFAPSAFFQVLFSGLIIWFLGCELQRIWGLTQYVFLLSISAFIGGLLYIAVSLMFAPAVAAIPLAGLAGVSASLCLLYALFYPERQFIFMFLFPMKAKYFCALLIGIILYQGIFTPGAAQAWGHLGAMIGAYLGYRLLMKAAFVQWLNSFVGRFSGRPLYSSSRGQERWSRTSKQGRGHLKIVKDEQDPDEKPPRYWQ